MYGKLVKISGSQVVIDVSDEIDMNKLKRFSDSKQPTVEVLIDDGRSISRDQQKKIFSMFHDISEYTGYSIEEVEHLMKYRYMLVMKHPKMFHLGYQQCSKSFASEFLTFIIDFCIRENIPFKTKVWDEIRGNYSLVRRCVEHRMCIICGKPHAEVDHVITVGAGRNRRTIDQHGMPVWTLCKNHHKERHDIGVVSFAKKYLIKPINLDDELIKKLKLTNIGELERQNDY